MNRSVRRSRRPSGQAQAVALMLRGLADRIETGTARANLRVEGTGQQREVWLVAASVDVRGGAR